MSKMHESSETSGLAFTHLMGRESRVLILFTSQLIRDFVIFL